MKSSMVWSGTVVGLIGIGLALILKSLWVAGVTLLGIGLGLIFDELMGWKQ